MSLRDTLQHLKQVSTKPKSMQPTPALQHPEPVLAFLFGCSKYIRKIEGEWDFTTPIDRDAALAYLKPIARTLAKDLPEESAQRARLLEFKKQALTDHPLCIAVDGIDIQPNGPPIFRVKGKSFINRWVPPVVQSKQGKWPNLREVLDYLTADPDGTPNPEGARWLLHWMAAKIQSPEYGLNTSPIIHGPPGSGKNTLLNAFMLALGRENCGVINQQQLESKYTLGRAAKLLVFADDCIPAEGMRGLSERLKTEITGERIYMEAKYLNAIEVPNRSVWVFTSNRQNPVVVEANDRRYSVFSNRVPITPEWEEFLRSFWAPSKQNVFAPWVETELAAFRYDLERLQVDRTFIGRPFENAARDALISENEDAEAAFRKHVEENLSDPALGGLWLIPLTERRKLEGEIARTRNGYAPARANMEAHLEGQRLAPHGQIGADGVMAPAYRSADLYQSMLAFSADNGFRWVPSATKFGLHAAEWWFKSKKGSFFYAPSLDPSGKPKGGV